MARDLTVVNHDGVKARLVQQELLQHQLVHHGAYIVDGHAGSLHLEKLGVHIALQDDFVAHHRDDLLELLQVPFFLRMNVHSGQQEQANEGQ